MRSFAYVLRPAQDRLTGAHAAHSTRGRSGRRAPLNAAGERAYGARPSESATRVDLGDAAQERLETRPDVPVGLRRAEAELAAGATRTLTLVWELRAAAKLVLPGYVPLARASGGSPSEPHRDGRTLRPPMMTSPQQVAARYYLCPQCTSPAQGPVQGGPAACPQCGAPFTLPDRSALLATPIQVAHPNNDPQRLAQLRLQDGRPRLPTPTLQAVLGGNAILPGREQEALAIWQSLRARAATGDVSASEDLAILTLMVAQLPSMEGQEAMLQALGESAFDAAVLPRHKQEQLGRLVRRAVAAGDRARALRLLSWMTPSAPELDADSEFRVASAVVATLDRDPQRVLALLGQQKDAVPIADSMDPLASVFRANAYEMLSNIPAATQILHELPDTRILGLVRSRFPTLRLCTQSAPGFEAAATQQAAQRAAASAGNVGLIVGAALGFSGVIALIAAVVALIASGFDENELAGSAIPLFIGVALTTVGIVIVIRARGKAKHAAWLRTHGLSLTARIVNVDRTGTEINDVPLYRFILQVAGPQGPYQASFNKLAPEHEVARVLGQEVRVRANPERLDDVVLED